MENTILAMFREYLLTQDRAALTVQGYLSDLVCFVRWFEQTNGESLSLPAVTPTDVREYRQYLVTVQGRKPATVNRHLAAISALMAWAKHTGQVEHDPTEEVRGVPQVPHGPRSLDRFTRSKTNRTNKRK